MKILFIFLAVYCWDPLISKNKSPLFGLLEIQPLKMEVVKVKMVCGDGEIFFMNHLTQQRFTLKIAQGERSSRTYQTEGLWDEVLKRIKPGDFVVMQFGHNDAGAVNDTLRARGSIKGIGEETEEIDNLITKKHEIVHSYGWYIRKYIRGIKAKGGIAIVCSPVARNDWKDGKVPRSTYSQWASIVAKEEKAFYIDLNDLVAVKYESLGAEGVSSKLFLKDHTHTTLEGAKINARLVGGAIKQQRKLSLRKYLKN